MIETVEEFQHRGHLVKAHLISAGVGDCRPAGVGGDRAGGAVWVIAIDGIETRAFDGSPDDPYDAVKARLIEVADEMLECRRQPEDGARG